MPPYQYASLDPLDLPYDPEYVAPVVCVRCGAETGSRGECKAFEKVSVGCGFTESTYPNHLFVDGAA